PKTLAAFLVVPGITLGYLVCAPGSLRRRAAQLLVAALAMVVVSGAWLAFVDITPASKRPYVGSSTNNSELGLTFEYNGFGRVEGQAGGPNSVVVKPGARVPLPHHSSTAKPKPKTPAAKPPAPKPASSQSSSTSRRAKYPIPFGGPPGPLRLFGTGLGDQAAWMLPFALFGLLAVALLAWVDRRRTSASEGAHGDANVTPEPETGPAPTRELGPRRLWALALAPCAVAATVAAQLVLMHREHYMLWFTPLLIGGAAVGLGGLVALQRLALPALALIFVVLLIAPTGYAASTWLAPVEGTFPVAGPTQTAGSQNGFGVSDRDLEVYRALDTYASAHRPGTRWAVLTVASDTAAPLMLM